MPREKKTVKQKVKADEAQAKTEQTMPSENTENTENQAADAQAKTAAKEPEKTVTVKFMASADEAGSKPIDLHVNGKFYTFSRNVEVDVPEHVLEVIDHAVATTYERKGKVMVAKQVPRFPYQTVR